MTEPPNEAYADSVARHRAEKAIQQRVDANLPALRKRLARLHPLEQMAILGNLNLDAFLAMEPGQRMATCVAWCDTLRDAVLDSLD